MVSIYRDSVPLSAISEQQPYDKIKLIITTYSTV